MPDWFVTVNRAAGRRPTDPSTVSQVLSGLGLKFELVAPKTVDEMIESLVVAAESGHRRFAIGGGDGTVNLAVNTLLNLELDVQPTLGVLPIGTGCDLLRTFAIPQTLEGAAGHLASPDTYLCDVGVLEGDWGVRYFLNVAQAGVGAAAAETATRMSRMMGSVRYPLAFGVRLPRFPTATIRLETERSVVESEALAVILANAQFFAGGWNVAPKANMVDGLLDVQIINAKKTQAPALVPKVIKGTHLQDPAVRRLTAAEFSLTTEPNWPVEADGDLVGNTTVRGRVVPAAIRLKI
jgi:diacylglycerol kinase (ATP)